MPVLLYLDPSLPIRGDELAKAWNEDPKYRSLAEAQTSQTPPATFVDPLVAQGVISFAVTVTGGLTMNLLLDMIRDRVRAKGIPSDISGEERKSPAGDQILIVKADEKKM